MVPEERAVDEAVPLKRIVEAEEPRCRRTGLPRHRMDGVFGVLGTGDFQAAMAKGYRAMGKLNLALAKEDEATLSEWPDFDVQASEADPSGDS